MQRVMGFGIKNQDASINPEVSGPNK